MALPDSASIQATSADPQATQEYNRQLQSGMSMAYMALFLGDERHPDFWPVINQAFRVLGPNPDDTYYLAPIESSGVYKISGYRGTVHMVDVQIGSGLMFTRGGSLGPILATFDLEDLSFGPDGSFDVVLSAERPRSHAGNWWKLEHGATYIMIRQVAYDWMNEIDGRYAIERLDTPAQRPRASAAQIESKLRAIPAWAENMTKIGQQWLAGYRAKGLINTVAVQDLTGYGGVSGQRYIEGLFELEPHEALIYETEIPAQCRYWNVQLTDLLWAGIDWTNRQTSLNGHSARLDRDGRFRAVICGEDPGVPNWLDTAGYRTGAILGRWTECSSYPVPTVTKIPLAAVRGYLPADTPNVTLEERDTQLRSRRRAAQLRRRW